MYCTCTSEVRKYTYSTFESTTTFVRRYFRTSVLPYLYFRTEVLPYFRTSVHVRTEVTRVFVLPYSMTDRADQIKYNYTYTWLISCNNLSRAYCTCTFESTTTFESTFESTKVLSYLFKKISEITSGPPRACASGPAGGLTGMEGQPAARQQVHSQLVLCISK